VTAKILLDRYNRGSVSWCEFLKKREYGDREIEYNSSQEIGQVTALRLVILLQGVSVCLKNSQTTRSELTF